MNERIIPLAIFTVIVLLLDAYSLYGINSLISDWQPSRKKIFYIIYGILTVLTMGVMLMFLITRSASDIPDWVRVGVVAPLFILMFAKVVFIVFLFINDLVRGVAWLSTKVVADVPYDPSRINFITKIGALAAGTLFGSLIYGIVRGAYNYQVHKKTIAFKNLPDAFQGFKIVQISDMHIGSFLSERPLETAISIINKLQPDMILFTGDMVNNVNEEIIPYMDTLKKLSAPKGIYSVLGNHDYGDYVRWSAPEKKVTNLNDLKNTQKEIGWRLLLDEHVRIEKGGDFINLIGVQNWGAKGRFPKYGNLQKATEGMDTSRPSILMSHDPSHWKAQVTQPPFQHIDLTLSGHTHGMQFGVEIPGWIKWSPVKYMYEQWAGLYEDGAQKLYVNRGLGFLGYPGRVGISPEITLLKLQKS